MRGILLVICAMAAAVYLVYAVVTIDRSSDQRQITALIESAATAMEGRDLGGAVAGLSKNYRDDAGMNYDRLRVLAVQALRSEPAYTVRVAIEGIWINGENAEAIVHAAVHGGINYDRHVTVILQKESGRHAVVIPVRVWRVVGTRNLGVSDEGAF